jgi:hypothetical protein
MRDTRIRPDDASTAGRPDTVRRGHTRPSIRAWVTARLRAARFERALAVGVPAPAGSALAVHAARLSCVAERHAVARALRRAVHDATDTRPTRYGRVPMHRANIASAQALIDAVTRRLHAPTRSARAGWRGCGNCCPTEPAPSTGTAVAISRVV